MVKVRSQSASVFYVVKRLGIDVILGCDFCDAHVKSICPRQRPIELIDGAAEPIFKEPEKEY